MTVHYQFRYFFDHGSGICLWAANDATREKYSYAIDHWELPISENTKRKIDYLIAWHATGLDWSYPPDPSPWPEEEFERFKRETAAFLSVLRKELGDEFEIVDERYK